MDGALFSTGDGHFAQGDGEVCVTAVEMGATCSVRFRVHRGEAERHGIRWPRFSRSDYFIDPRWAAPQKFIATMGMPVDEHGVNQGENLNLACRNAILNMMQLLQERGFSREQAYCICSVAADLRISNVVDLPNVVVSALLPEDVLAGLRARAAPSTITAVGLYTRGERFRRVSHASSRRRSASSSCPSFAPGACRRPTPTPPPR